MQMEQAVIWIVCRESSVIQILSLSHCVEYNRQRQEITWYEGKRELNSATLSAGFLRSFERFPGRPALEVNSEVWSYQRLNTAAALAATLQHQQPRTEPNLTAVLAHRSSSAFVGILGTLFRGHGYVPINPNFPSERIVTILNRSGCESLIVGSEAIQGLGEILARVENSLYVYLPDYDDVTQLEVELPRHVFVPMAQFRDADDWVPDDTDDAAAAYLLFTSGSTGIPKRVEVSHRNIRYFIEFVVERYAITEHDRFSQMFELVFDLSLFDMFVVWEYRLVDNMPLNQNGKIDTNALLQTLQAS